MGNQDCLCGGTGRVETHGYSHGCPECGKNWSGYPPELQKRINWENKHGRAYLDDSTGAPGSGSGGFVEVKGGLCCLVAFVLMASIAGAVWVCVRLVPGLVF